MLYSVDLRKKVMLALKSQKSKIEVCNMFNICRQTLYNWIKLEAKQGNLLPLTGFQKGHPPAIKNDHDFK